MSVSDFVNRKVGGSTVTGAHYKGAIQAAVDTMDLNDKVEQDVYSPVLYRCCITTMRRIILIRTISLPQVEVTGDQRTVLPEASPRPMCCGPWRRG